MFDALVAIKQMNDAMIARVEMLSTTMPEIIPFTLKSAVILSQIKSNPSSMSGSRKEKIIVPQVIQPEKLPKQQSKHSKLPSGHLTE